MIEFVRDEIASALDDMAAVFAQWATARKDGRSPGALRAGLVAMANHLVLQDLIEKQHIKLHSDEATEEINKNKAPVIIRDAVKDIWLCFTPGSRWTSIGKTRHEAVLRWEQEHHLMDGMHGPSPWAK